MCNLLRSGTLRFKDVAMTDKLLEYSSLRAARSAYIELPVSP